MAAPILIFIHGPLAGKRVALDQEDHTIGRGSQNQVVLKDPLVSRVHAIVIRRGGVYLLEDLGSHNGTYVNDERLHAIRHLRHGDRISLGSSRMLFEDPTQITDDPTQISDSSGLSGTTMTQRQLQVLRLMARGLSSKQIGERLFVSERTVKAYVASIFEKLGVNKRAAAVAAALRLGLIDAAREDDSDD
ncbi:MAG TPA: FHA domain-containing protein [Actinomycetota bacterium]|nr:FHA domain-containing protein [Actinomycetota bacterium]